MREPLVLLAHGSRDPRAGASTRALARAVAAARPGLPVRVAFLDHAPPAPRALLDGLAGAGHRRAVVVPLLLTSAYHGRVDVPAAVAGAPLDVAVAPVLGPDDLLVAGLRRRLPVPDADAVVLAAAGTRDPGALAAVEGAAAALGASLGVPCRTAYASASPPTVEAAIGALRAGGARRVAVAAYFLAPGLLYDRIVTGADPVPVAAPLGDAPELVRVVLDRYATASRLRLPTAA